MSTRREFLQDATQGALAWTALSLTRSADGSSIGASSAPAAPSVPPPAVDSDIGSLYPFIQSQAVKGEFPLSFLQPRVHATCRPGSGRRAASSWSCCTTPRRPATRGPRSSSASTAATTCGRGSTSTPRPTSACPPIVLIPKRAHAARRPAIVALHDHGGFYFWGKEKLVEAGRRAPGPDRLQAAVLRGPEHRQRAGARGVRGGRHRHVLLGRAADAAGRRPGRLARAAPRASPPSGSPRSTGAPARASSSSAGPSTPPASPGRA